MKEYCSLNVQNLDSTHGGAMIFSRRASAKSAPPWQPEGGDSQLQQLANDGWVVINSYISASPYTSQTFYIFLLEREVPVTEENKS